MGQRIVALLLLPSILAFFTLLGLGLLSLTGAVERAVVRLFAEHCNGRLELEAARLDSVAGLRFDQVRITVAHALAPLFSARTVLVNLPTSGLLQGSIQPRSITLIEPILTLEDLDDGGLALTRLLEPLNLEGMARQVSGQEERAPFSIFLSRGQIRFDKQTRLVSFMASWFRPDRELQIEMPSFYCVEKGNADATWLFGGLLVHQALGEIQVEGEADEQGIRRLLMVLEGADLQAPAVHAFFSDAALEVIDRAGVQGVLRARVEAERQPTGQIELEVAVRGFDVTPADFPLHFQKVTARILPEASGFRLEQGRADVLGGSARFRAEVRPGQNPLVTFTLAGESIPFCKELERAVDEVDGGEDYRAFAPEGYTDFVYEGRYMTDLGTVLGDLTIRPLRASASYEGYYDPLTHTLDAFPYRLYGLEGEVRANEQGVEIRWMEGRTRPAEPTADLAEQASQGRVIIKGRVDTSGPQSVTDLKVVGQDLLFDEGLIQGLRKVDPETADLLAPFNPSGRFDLDLHIDGSVQAGELPDLKMNLKEMAFQHEEVPFSIRGVRGRVEKDGRAFRLDNLTGYRGGDPEGEKDGPVIVNGLIREGCFERLQIEGREQRVTRRMKELLEQVLPRSLGFLTRIDYQGCSDFQLTFPEGVPSDIFDLSLNLAMDRVSGGPVPIPLEEVQGAIRLDFGGAGLSAAGLSLRAGAGRFTFTELKTREEAGFLIVEAHGKGDHLALDADLSGLLEAQALSEWRILGCRGGVDLEEMDVLARIDLAEGLDTLETSLKVRFNGGSIDFPVPITDIHGDLSLSLRQDEGQGGAVVVRGETGGTSFQLSDRLFTEVEAAFTLTPERFSLDRARGGFYGGRIYGRGEPPLWLDLAAPRAFQGRVEVEDADLKHFFGRGDYAFRNVEGRVNGALRFQGELDNAHRTEGEGFVQIEKGTLFELPFFGKLSRLMGNVFSTEPPTFHEAGTNFFFREGVFDLDNIVLDSSVIRLNGAGKATLDGVDLSLIPSNSIVPKIPILGDILDIIKDGLLTFKVSGLYDDLTVSYDSPVERLFGDGDVPDEPRYRGRIAYKFTERF